ncbi:MAG TPA: hypothetical protein PKE54_19915, partial [Candidatus Obscuribacter sp.]|nr:hypothetical protein [Candidatus Obscuribacter sp.]
MACPHKYEPQASIWMKALELAKISGANLTLVEDPKLAKGLVKREVSRVVTPGTLTDDALLDPRESNFLATVYPT